MLSGIDDPKLEFITELYCGIHQFASTIVMHTSQDFKKNKLWIEAKVNEFLYIS